MAPSLCGDTIRSKRSLLAACWTVVNLLALLAFLSAGFFTLTTQLNTNNRINNNGNNNNNNNNYYYQEGEEQQQQNQRQASVVVTSRAMTFAALWTAAIACILCVFGTVLLGFQSPRGRYYWCCPTNVHTTNPLTMGSFIGALLMFANLTLVCSVLFGEFQIRDYQQQEGEGGEKQEEWIQDSALSRSSLAFSIMCMFLTIIYGGFAALVYTYADDLFQENAIDSREEALTPSDPEIGTGFISSDRFGVRTGKPTHFEGFISPQNTRIG